MPCLKYCSEEHVCLLTEAPRTITMEILPLTIGRKAGSSSGGGRGVVAVVTGPLHVAAGKLLSRKHLVIHRGSRIAGDG
eukprot:COSAG01_NODE_30924_length_607_cov_0.444882_2_plen_78_part_01